MTGSIVTRLFRISFCVYVLVAILLNVLLVAQEYADTQAKVRHELQMYQDVFGAPLADALWAMDISKLDAVADGVVTVPEITGLRITDAVTGHLFVSAVNDDGRIVLDHSGRDEGIWTKLVNEAGASHYGFDLVSHHEAGNTVVGRAEFVSGRPYLMAQIRSRTIFIIGTAVLKETALWVVFLMVGRRILSRPLTALYHAIDATTPENPTPIALSQADER